MALIVAGGLGLGVVLTLWRRIRPRVAALLLGLLGVVLGTGALLLQDDPGPADWAVVLSVLAISMPVHFRFAFGSSGGSSGGST